VPGFGKVGRICAIAALPRGASPIYPEIYFEKQSITKKTPPQNGGVREETFIGRALIGVLH
jgi:hypothetical protein